MTGPDDETQNARPDPSAPPVPAEEAAGEADILDVLGGYLDRGEEPPAELVGSSPENHLALAALLRVRDAAQSLVDVDEEGDGLGPGPREGWVESILANVQREVRAGRRIPLTHPSPRAQLTLTEGAVRGLIRAAGDGVDGALIGRCILEGDVTVPGTPITVRVEASVFWGESIPVVAEQLRQAVAGALLQHTELRIEAIDVTITDVHLRRTTAPSGEDGESV